MLGQETAVDDGFAEALDLFLGTVVPVMFVLLVAIVSVRMGVRWLTKWSAGGALSDGDGRNRYNSHGEGFKWTDPGEPF